MVVFASRDKFIIKAYQSNFQDLVNVQVVRCDIPQVPYVDCIVYSGNSFGNSLDNTGKTINTLLGGVENRIKNVIDNIFYGEQPLGTCSIISTGNNKYKYLAYLPICRLQITDKKYPYTAFRALITAILNHNKISDDKITTVLCPPLCFEGSDVEHQEVARQMRLAFSMIDLNLGCTSEATNMIRNLL